MADPEVLIRIRKILETQGADKAQAEIRKLVEAETDAAKGASAQSGETEKLQRQLDRLRQTSQGTAQALNGGEGALRGFGGAARGLSELLGGRLATSLAGVGAILMAGKIGWDVGKWIDGWIGLSDKISGAGRSADDFGSAMGRAREETAKLAKEKFDALREQVKGMSAELKALLADMDAAEARQAKVREAKQDLRKAQIEALPEGTWQERAAKEKAMAEFTAASGKETMESQRAAATARYNIATGKLYEVDNRQKELDAVAAEAEQGWMSRPRQGVDMRDRRRQAQGAREMADEFRRSTSGMRRELGDVRAEASADIEALGFREEAAPIRTETARRKIARDEVEAFARERAEREGAQAERAEANVKTWSGLNRSGGTQPGYITQEGDRLSDVARRERREAQTAETELKELLDGNVQIMERMAKMLADANQKMQNLPR